MCDKPARGFNAKSNREARRKYGKTEGKPKNLELRSHPKSGGKKKILEWETPRTSTSKVWT